MKTNLRGAAGSFVGFKLGRIIVMIIRKAYTLFAEQGFDANPKRPERTRHDNGDDGAPADALDLLDALAPTPQMPKVGLKFFAVLFLDAE